MCNRCENKLYKTKLKFVFLLNYLGNGCGSLGRTVATLGNFLKPLATINLPKALTF